MPRKFLHRMGRLVLGLAVALTACAPMQATTPTTAASVSVQQTISPTFTPDIPATSTPTPAPAMQAPQAIMANQGWQSAYQFIHPGDQLEITAAGAWSHDPADSQFSNPYGPAGTNLFDARAVLASAPLGSMVGRIGDNPPFVIGEYLVLTSTYRGELWVSMNDSPDRYSDNTGFVGVAVKLTPKPPVPGTPLTNITDHYRLVYPQGYYVAITQKGICITQNPNPTAEICDLFNVATLQVGDANNQTAAQLADQLVLVNDPNLTFESHPMLVDGEQAVWISRAVGDGVATIVMIAHGTHFYLWSFTSKYPVPDWNIAAEIEQVQKLYDTVINSFQFLD